MRIFLITSQTNETYQRTISYIIRWMVKNNLIHPLPSLLNLLKFTGFALIFWKPPPFCALKRPFSPIWMKSPLPSKIPGCAPKFLSQETFCSICSLKYNFWWKNVAYCHLWHTFLTCLFLRRKDICWSIFNSSILIGINPSILPGIN